MGLCRKYFKTFIGMNGDLFLLGTLFSPLDRIHSFISWLEEEKLWSGSKETDSRC